jgi:hypothetical protein
MYYWLAGTDSDGVVFELTLHGSPGSLENASACWATRFVVSTRAPKAAIGGQRIPCSESSDTGASESHSPLPHCAMSVVSSRAIFWHSRSDKAAIETRSNGKFVIVSSRPGVW